MLRKIFIFMVVLAGISWFSGNSMAAGYSCPTYKQYTSCSSGYYMTQTSSSTACYTTFTNGNACRPCSTYGSGYTCAGGTACPVASTVTCSAGQYLPANASSCSTCTAGYKCPSSSVTYNKSSSDQGRTPCSGTNEYQPNTGQTTCLGLSDGYYKNGNTAQQACGTGHWCKNGVRTACASGTSTIGYGAGANEAGDCGKVLNIDSAKLYLRSVKKTTPSLNFNINGTTYYGNLDTSGKGKLRVNNGTTTYSVTDDSM